MIAFSTRLFHPKIMKHARLSNVLQLIWLCAITTCAFANERLYFLSELDAAPGIIERADPVYPAELKGTGKEGSVRFAIKINPQGNASVLLTLESSDPAMEAAGKAYVDRLKYETPLREGEPVAARSVLSVDFKPENGGRAQTTRPKTNSLDEELAGLSARERIARLKQIIESIDGVPLGDASKDSSTANQRSFSLNELDSMPKRISGAPPAYPYDLRRDRVEGNVKLLVVIDTDGSVTVESVVEADHLAFIVPAIKSAESCIFQKPMVNGRAVKTKFLFPIQFRIHDSKGAE